MSSLVDVVIFNPVGAGASDFVVSAARLGYLTPAAAGAVNGATYSYRAESADLAQWEVGRGVWNAGSDTLTRAVVLYNSLGNTAKINFTLVPQVGLVALATDVAALDGIAHYTNTTEATGVGTTYAARFEGGVEFAKKVFITGGVGVGGALNVGGAIIGSEVFAGSASFAYGVRGVYSIASGTNNSYMFWGNATNNERARLQVTDSRQLYFSLDNGTTGHLSVTTTKVNIPMTAAATSGSTGALTVAGGVGVSGTVYANGGVTASGNGITLAAYYQSVLANCYYDGAWKYLGNGLAWGMGNNFGGGSSATTIAVATTNASGANAALSWNPVLDIAPTQVKVIPNTASSSTTTGALIVGGGVGVGGSIYAGASIIGAGIYSTGAMKCSHPTAGLGYDTGAGGTVTQATNRTTGVTLNKSSGAITLFSQVNTAISQATAQSFTVTNSAVAATDTIIVSQKSGTDKYEIFVTNVAAGSFQITNYAVAGTTNEAPVFNFTVIKGVTS